MTTHHEAQSVCRKLTRLLRPCTIMRLEHYNRVCNGLKGVIMLQRVLYLMTAANCCCFRLDSNRFRSWHGRYLSIVRRRPASSKFEAPSSIQRAHTMPIAHCCFQVTCAKSRRVYKCNHFASLRRISQSPWLSHSFSVILSTKRC
jgi:hypothetical protein